MQIAVSNTLTVTDPTKEMLMWCKRNLVKGYFKDMPVVSFFEGRLHHNKGEIKGVQFILHTSLLLPNGEPMTLIYSAYSKEDIDTDKAKTILSSDLVLTILNSIRVKNIPYPI